MALIDKRKGLCIPDVAHKDRLTCLFGDDNVEITYWIGDGRVTGEYLQWNEEDQDWDTSDMPLTAVRSFLRDKGIKGFAS